MSLNLNPHLLANGVRIYNVLLTSARSPVCRWTDVAPWAAVMPAIKRGAVS